MSMFLLVSTVATVLLLSDEADEASANTCPQWVKLNKSPVCFEGKDNKYSSFTINRNIFVSQFMFVRRTGTVTCNKSQYSYWGCPPNGSGLGAVLTDDQNRILAPDASKVNSKTLSRVTPLLRLPSCSVLPKNLNVSSLTASFACGMERTYVVSLRASNGGKSCADVYGLLA